MNENPKAKREARRRRAARVRRKIRGTAECPRLAVFRSLKNITAQLIDDEAGVTLAYATSQKVEAAADAEATRKVANAEAVGRELARQAQEKGINAAVFDRAGYKFHGRVAALAAGARDGGLKF